MASYFVVLLCSMNKAYVKTFVSRETGRKSIQKLFTDNEDDAVRFSIFTKKQIHAEESDRGRGEDLAGRQHPHLVGGAPGLVQ